MTWHVPVSTSQDDAVLSLPGGDDVFIAAGVLINSNTNATVKDSRIASRRDLIQDFSRAQGDRIELLAIDASTKAAGNQSFKFIGTAAFTGHAGELRQQKIGTDTHIFADTNGDKIADLTIVSNVALSFVAGDFVL